MAYDLAIIGSGAAGFAAAIAARRLGKKVVMVERSVVGGTCVNTGCVPSKALLAAAEARHVALDRRFPGIDTDARPADLKTLTAATDELVAAMRTAKYLDLANDHGWPILIGTATFRPGPILEVAVADGIRTVDAEHYLVATGSAPVVPAIAGLAEAGYLTSTTAMRLDTLPGSLLVMGGGATGLELAQLFARLGSRVTVVEALDRLAPHEEPEASAAIEDALRDEGIEIHTGAQLREVHRAGERITTTLDGRTITTDQVLVATGRRPVTKHLNLAAVGVDLGVHGEVTVDEQLRTGNSRIWAAGDVTGHPQFVYVAATHGGLVVDNAFSNAGRSVDYRHLPRVTFTDPAVASVGFTEAQATDEGYAVESRVLPLTQVPRAIVERDTRGMVKLVADRHTGQLLGVTAVAAGAAELIAAATFALTAGTTVEQLGGLWCPYLSMTEALKLAAQAFVHDVAKLSCCAA